VIALLALPVMLVLAVAPVAADTVPDSSGTYFNSNSSTCVTSGARETCTDTNLYTFPEEGGTSTLCVDTFTYSISSNGRSTFGSDEYGCTTDFEMTVAGDYSVTVAPADISVATCKAHKRSCSGSDIVTVSASDTATGDVTTSTTRSTIKSGGCTYRTTTNVTSVPVAGTMTIDGTTFDETGSVDIVDETSTVRCK